MDMQTVVSFLNSDYKKYKGKIHESPPEILETITYLSHITESYGHSYSRAVLSEKGVRVIPQIVHTIDDLYIPRALASKLIYNGREEYVLAYYELLYQNIERARPLDLIHTVGRNSINKLFMFENEALNIHYELSNGRTYSLQNIIDYGYECDECGATYIDRDYWDNSAGEEILCPTCRIDIEPYQYSTRVEDILGYEDTKETLFGIELEYEGVRAKQVKKLLPHYALPKSDGSIGDGVEIVTKPACVATHKKELRLLFDNIRTVAHSNTGMHVHIEKRKLSEYQIGFMLEFLNKEDLTVHIEKIAGRNYKDNHYCKTDKYATMTKGLFWDKRLMRNETDKYTTFNTRKNKTVEIRIFASPESYMECVARLEFVEGLVLFSSPYSMHVKSLKDKFKWETFEQYMQTNKKHFPYFNCMYLA
jgi:hypothetical protein